MTDLPKFAELPHTAEILVALVKTALNTKFNYIYFDLSEMHVDPNGYFNPGPETSVLTVMTIVAKPLSNC